MVAPVVSVQVLLQELDVAAADAGVAAVYCQCALEQIVGAGDILQTQVVSKSRVSAQGHVTHVREKWRF